MKGIVDRIENGIVVVEVGEEYKTYDLNIFPKELKEGDIVSITDGEVEILVEETQTRSEYISNLFEELLNKNSK